MGEREGVGGERESKRESKRERERGREREREREGKGVEEREIQYQNISAECILYYFSAACNILS